MKKSIRKTTVIMATLALSFAAAGMFNLNWETASADTTAPNVSMVSGASIRLGASESKNGMRFSMKMDKNEYETMMSDTKYTDVEFGVIIAPNATGYTDISYDTVFGASKKYDWATWDDETNKWVYTGTDTDAYTQIMLYSFDKMYVYASANTWESEDEVYVRGTISNVQNETREFQGIGYVKYKYDGTQKHVFLTPELRSMTHVAQMAAEKNPSAAEDLATMYITDYAKGGVKATTTSFTEEYYFEQADGTYQLDENKTKTVTQYNDDDVYIHDEVTAAKPHFDGYVFNSTHKDNVATGHAYANDKLVLKRYYKRLDPLKLEGSYTNVIADNSNNVDNWYNTTNSAFDVGISAYSGEEVTDSNNVTYMPATVFSLKGQNINSNVGPLFGFYNGIEKSDLEELRENGYDYLTFAVKLNSITKKYPRLRTLDFAKMRELKAAGTAITKSTLTDVLPAANEVITIQNWGTVYYALDDLIEFYDELFTEGTPVPFAQLYIYQSGWSEEYTYYLTNFSVVDTYKTKAEYDTTNIVTDATLFTAKRIDFEWTNASLQSNVLGTETVEVYNETVSNRLNASVSKTAAFKISLSETDEAKVWDNTVAFTLSSDFMTKEVLQEFIDDGYQTFTFSVYRQQESTATYENYIGLRTIDFEKMRTNAASVNDKETAKNNYTATSNSYRTNTWQTVTYNLSDLLEFYDVLFAENTPYFLCEAGSYHIKANDTLYISAFSIE